jgi:signal transduction histidine kinase
MMVSVNGEGFDTKQALKKSSGQGSLGLMNMRERADPIGAKLKIKLESGHGTSVRVEIDL